MRAKAPERGRFYLAAVALLNKREVAAVDPFIKHPFSKDVLHAGHLAESSEDAKMHSVTALRKVTI